MHELNKLYIFDRGSLGGDKAPRDPIKEQVKEFLPRPLQDVIGQNRINYLIPDSEKYSVFPTTRDTVNKKVTQVFAGIARDSRRDDIVRIITYGHDGKTIQGIESQERYNSVLNRFGRTNEGLRIAVWKSQPEDKRTQETNTQFMFIETEHPLNSKTPIIEDIDEIKKWLNSIKNITREQAKQVLESQVTQQLTLDPSQDYAIVGKKFKIETEVIGEENITSLFSFKFNSSRTLDRFTREPVYVEEKEQMHRIVKNVRNK